MLKNSLKLICGLIIGLVIYHYWIIDIVIDKRAERLGMMRYSAECDKMIPTEECVWTLKYLKDGTMR